MNPEIKELSTRLHELHEQIMITDPWADGYGEVISIHDYLLRALREKAHKDFEEFKAYLTETAKEIEETWTSNSSMLSSWSEKLRPLFEKVETIVSGAVPLLALL